MLMGAWSPAPARVPPHGPDVHVWRIDVPRWRSRVPTLARLLAADEQERADRFRSESDVHRFIVGRGVLRLLVGQLLQRPPTDVVFTYSASGKPSIARVEFNVAHSGDVALIAMHRHRIGVDVERVDCATDIAMMSRACLTERERVLVMQDTAVQNTFFQVWARKEAWLKAVGTGLCFPPTRIDVADPDAPVIAPDAAIDGPPPSRIVDLAVAPAYVAACAISGPDCAVHLWRLPQTWGGVAGTT